MLIALNLQKNNLIVEFLKFNGIKFSLYYTQRTNVYSVHCTVIVFPMDSAHWTLLRIVQFGVIPPLIHKCDKTFSKSCLICA